MMTICDCDLLLIAVFLFISQRQIAEGSINLAAMTRRFEAAAAEISQLQSTLQLRNTHIDALVVQVADLERSKAVGMADD
jgi:hypothetical protein